MAYLYLLIFGALVLVIFLAGVFYTVGEFNEMSNHPDDFKKDRNKIDRAD